MTSFALAENFNALPWLTGIVCFSLMAGFGGYLFPPVIRFLVLIVCGLTGGLAYLGFAMPIT